MLYPVQQKDGLPVTVYSKTLVIQTLVNSSSQADEKNGNKSDDNDDDDDNDSNNNASKKPKNKPNKKILANKAKPFSLQF